MTPQYEQFNELAFCIPKVMRAALDARLKPFGLSQARWQVLLKLRHSGRALSQHELAQRVGIEPASLVRHLDALQQDGLIEREADPVDRRAKRVTLTAQGDALSQQLMSVAQSMRAELLQDVSEAELQVCIDVLSRLKRKALQAVAPLEF
ncbi:MarR family winged helix-turn-helix transcriptional regulator [Paludibacterium yongneupense]|uniref:MarR family winged helix-turn-helix transcriptional regulator n=1 Tax=Paludibacterium yongneupense TaxID=400061 RepID=UPI0003FBFF7E|nr:MarR family transcriptional regulator [Paludibacterium yongneupense]